MLSKEDLARIVRDEVENHVKKGKAPYSYYYILLNGKIYPQNNYNKEVAEGKRSANDIYALVDVIISFSFNEFPFRINYLEIPSVGDVVLAYLRKAGFTIVNKHKLPPTVYEYDLPPTPNLKYFIYAVVEYNDDTPEYLVVNVYDIDSLARSFRIPQITEQELGSQLGEITTREFFDIGHTVIINQPLLAGYTYYDAHSILYYYYVDHKKKYKNEANKIVLAYSQLFPEPYRACYEWKAGIFVEIDCLKLELRLFSS